MKRLLITLIFAGVFNSTYSQMEDISVTLTPNVTYNWFGQKTTIENGFLYGGKIGFGFGSFLELAGIYEFSRNHFQDFSYYRNNITNLFPAFDFEKREIDIKRFGGEFKANIAPKSPLAPYLTLGAGVQRFTWNSNLLDGELGEVLPTSISDEQIYALAGIGIKLKLSQGLNLNIEARHSIFNFNSAVFLRDDNGSIDYAEWVNSQNETRMGNWAVMAGLQLYLGGRKPGELTALDREYLQRFSSGLKGLRFVLEPGGAWITFNDKSAMRNTYLVGGAAGINLSDYIGLRAFYYRATLNEQVSLDFDDFSMYGGEFIGRLNVARGIVPYVTLGAGYINVEDTYQGKVVYDEANNPINLFAESSYFVRSGLGLIVPLGRNVELFGAANLLYSTNKVASDLQDLQKPSELIQHLMFNTGVKFVLGASSDTQSELTKIVDIEAERLTALQGKRITELEMELQKAIKENDTRKAIELLEEKKRLEDSLKATKKTETSQKIKAIEPEIKVATVKKEVQVVEVVEKEQESTYIKLTPAELESLVERVFEGLTPAIDTKTVEVKKEVVEKTEKKEEQKPDEEIIIVEAKQAKELEKSLLEATALVNASQERLDKLELQNQTISKKVENLEKKLEATAKDFQERGVANLTPIPEKTEKLVEKEPLVEEKTESVLEREETITEVKVEDQLVDDYVDDSSGDGFFTFKAVLPFAGIGFGQGPRYHVGARGIFGLGGKLFSLAPDFYYEFADKNGIGLNANILVTLPIKTSSIINPYLGFGGGFNRIDDSAELTYNIIAGTYFNILGGNVFVDLTTRNLLESTQISLGYRINI